MPTIDIDQAPHRESRSAAGTRSMAGMSGSETCMIYGLEELSNTPYAGRFADTAGVLDSCGFMCAALVDLRPTGSQT